MKKNYSEPTMELVIFAVEDVVTISSEDTGTGSGGAGGGFEGPAIGV